DASQRAFPAGLIEHHKCYKAFLNLRFCFWAFVWACDVCCFFCVWRNAASLCASWATAVICPFRLANCLSNASRVREQFTMSVDGTIFLLHAASNKTFDRLAYEMQFLAT